MGHPQHRPVWSRDTHLLARVNDNYLAIGLLLRRRDRRAVALPAPPAPIVEPPLSIRLYSRADLNAAPFLCVVCDAARLRERGLLPLPAEIEAQIQVALPEPRHFILFAFGPKLAPLPCYPLSALADGEPRARLDLPRDLDPRAESIPLAGEPGAECLLMLLRPHAAAQAGPADVRSIQSRLARLLADTGAFALPHLDEPFRAAGALDSPQTREFNLRRAGPATDPLRRFLGEIQSRFAGEFAAHHFLGVARAEAPTTER